MANDPIPSGSLKVSALVVNYNSGDYAVNCIKSLQREAAHLKDRKITVECIVVDNASPRDQQPFREAVAALGERWIDQGWNAGYAAGVNRAFREAGGDLILVVNPDVSFLTGSLGRLIDVLTGEGGVGAVGPNTWWDINRLIQFPPNIDPTLGDALYQTLAHLSRWWNRRYALDRSREALKIWLSRGEVEVKLLSGGCVLVPRSVWEETGGMDTRFPLYYEDSDWFRRARRAGYRLLQVQDAHIAHFFNRSGVTDEGEAFARYWTSRRRYYRKHYGLPGLWVARLTRRLSHGGLARRLKPGPMDRIRDLGEVTEPFTLDLSRGGGPYLLELTQDPGFFMAGAIFGAGPEWRPSLDCWKVFGHTRFYLRGLDISRRDRPVHLGTWSFLKVAD